MQVQNCIFKKVFAFSCLLSIAACSCPRDPREAGLVCGIVNVSTGAYEEDNASLQRELTASLDRREKLERQRNKIEAERHRLSADRQQLALRLSAIHGELSASSQQLNDLYQQASIDRATLKELRALEEELTERQLALGEQVESMSPDDVQNLEKENELLRDQILALLARTN